MPIIFPREPSNHMQVFNRFERQVPGLRNSGPVGPVTVFRANPDGTPGRKLRVEKGKIYEQIKKDNRPRLK